MLSRNGRHALFNAVSQIQKTETNTDTLMIQSFTPCFLRQSALAVSLSQPSHLLCPEIASCYLAPSGGSLWPAVSPVFPTVGLGWGPECCL